jgi:hypothetical protein
MSEILSVGKAAPGLSPLDRQELSRPDDTSAAAAEDKLGYERIAAGEASDHDSQLSDPASAIRRAAVNKLKRAAGTGGAKVADRECPGSIGGGGHCVASNARRCRLCVTISCQADSNARREGKAGKLGDCNGRAILERTAFRKGDLPRRLGLWRDQY